MAEDAPLGLVFGLGCSVGRRPGLIWILCRERSSTTKDPLRSLSGSCSLSCLLAPHPLPYHIELQSRRPRPRNRRNLRNTRSDPSESPHNSWLSVSFRQARSSSNTASPRRPDKRGNTNADSTTRWTGGIPVPFSSSRRYAESQCL